MAPRSTVLSLLLLLVLSLSAFSQITITQSNVSGFGTVSTSYSTISDIVLSVGAAGANQTWVVPEVAVENVGAETILDPATTPYVASFPAATQAFHSGNPGSTGERYSYARIAANGSYGLGAATNFGGTFATIVIEPEALGMPFPTTFGTQWTKVTNSVFSPIPGRTVTLYDSTVYQIDGWGTIQTQFGSYSVLRAFAHEFNVTTSEFPPQPPSTDESSMYFYEWYKQDGAAVVRMNSVDDETNPNFTTGNIGFSVPGAQTAHNPHPPFASSFTLGQNCPNPFNPTTSLPISLEKAGTVEITIYNELGEVISSEIRSFGPGEHTVGFDGSAWASGNYFAQVKTNGQAQTKRMSLIK